jgi:hypothetical protein
MKYLFIDIRQSDEVFSKRFNRSKNYECYNIPMNMIRFNKEMIINHLNYVDVIYIVCQSGTRSQFIKTKYFKNNSKIKVNKNLQFKNLKHGMNQLIIENNKILIDIIGSNSFNMYNMMRIIQVLLGTIILVLGGYTYFQIKGKKYNNKLPLIILLFFGLMSLINGLTSTCTLSILLRNYIN